MSKVFTVSPLSRAVLLVLSILQVWNLSVSAADTNMSHPPRFVSTEERKINNSELEIIKGCSGERKRISAKMGADFSSETISYSKEYGFIFRYKSIEKVNEEVPLSGEAEIALWTLDCETFNLVTFSNYKLPASQ